MTSVTQVVKSVGPKLVFFFKTVAIYFVVYIPQDQPSILAMVLKSLPIISLIIFVLLHGMSLGNEYQYSRRIIAGLFFCCIGDVLLIWPPYFTLGMVSFAIGHLNYILAFGFKPPNIALGFLLYAISVAGIVYLMPGLEGILIPGVPIYTFVLGTMVWRAMARVQFFEDLWTWSKLCACAGGISFAISDFLIGVHNFHHNIEYAQALIMTTYYLAQLGIAMSVVDSKVIKDGFIKSLKPTHATTTTNVTAKSQQENVPTTSCAPRKFVNKMDDTT